MSRRLGVERALVAGAWVEGDVEVGADGRVAAVGIADGGRGRAGGRSRVAVPGFVDLQVNGFGGVDARTADPDDLVVLAEALAATGVTAFQPTCYSATPEVYGSFLEAVGEARRLQATAGTASPGATVLPAHIEGPFLSPAWPGAHDPACLVEPDLGLLSRLLAAGPVGWMTLAPELAGADGLIEALVAAGVVVAMGHTDADAATSARAVDLGVRSLTHCFNAHRRFGARDPGPAAVALTRPEVTVGLIADRVHVADDALRLAFAAAGERVAVVSDCIAPTGTGLDRWSVGDEVVTVAEGAARLVDGTLAGSVVDLATSLRNLLAVGIDPAVAVRAVSTTPARAVGRGPHDLTPGSVAEVTVLDDRWEVLGTAS